MSKPRVFLSPLTGRAYFSSDYRQDGRRVIAASKYDVTDDVVRDLMAGAWARGWNECNAASEGDAPPNPYRAPCPCGCPPDMHIGEIGCPCGLPDNPPCAPNPEEEDHG